MATLRKLGRRTDHRQAMLKNLVSSLFINGRIQTTVTRAKDAQRLTEKMITMAKKGTLAGNRQVSSRLYSNDVARKLVEEIAPKYQDRNGGYTRVLKLGPRRGDGAEMAILELVDEPVAKGTKKAPAEEQPAAVKADAPANDAEATPEPADEVSEETVEAEPADEESQAEAPAEEAE